MLFPLLCGEGNKSTGSRIIPVWCQGMIRSLNSFTTHDVCNTLSRVELTHAACMTSAPFCPPKPKLVLRPTRGRPS